MNFILNISMDHLEHISPHILLYIPISATHHTQLRRFHTHIIYNTEYSFEILCNTNIIYKKHCVSETLYNTNTMHKKVSFQNIIHHDAATMEPIIWYMHPANERRRYNVTSSLIGWAHSQNDPCYHNINTFTWKCVIIWSKFSLEWYRKIYLQGPILRSA